jgi:HK97 family phage portal protein
MGGLFGKLAGGLKEARTLDMLPGFLMGPESKTGISVTWSTALQVTAMFACCRVVGEDLAAARCRLMQRRKDGKGADIARDHPLHRLLFLEPMKGQTAFSFWESIAFHVMLVGNAYAYVSRGAGGKILELILLQPNRVTVTQHADLSLSYEVDGVDGQRRRFTARDIWHVRGPSWNGWMGMETVRLAREALGLSLALEESHARLHKDGAKASGVYSVEGPLTPEQHAQMTEWLKKFAASSAGTPMVLDRGAKWFNQQLTAVDKEHVETRRLQIEEVCRPVRVMPIMIGLADKVATYSSSEQMFLAHGNYTMTPWAGRIEQAIEVGLLTEEEQRDLYAKFNLSVQMRGDFKGRQEGLQIMRRNGVINADEWRDLEDWNPRDDDGGTQYIVEGNMAVQDGRDLVPVKNVIV